MATRCPQCQTATNVAREDYAYTLGGETLLTLRDVEVRRCSTCSHHEVIIPGGHGLMQQAALHVVERPARLTGKEVAFFRRYLSLEPETLARLLDVDLAAVLQWEGGALQVPVEQDRKLRMLIIRHLFVSTAGPAGSADTRLV